MVRSESLPDTDEFNTFRGLAITPASGETSKIINHIKEVLCGGNELLSEYVLNWIARMYQYPNDRGHTALVFKGEQGTGKGIILEDIIAKSWGYHGTVMSNPREIAGEFNEGLMMAIFVYVNEAAWGGNVKENSILKSVITDGTVRVRQMHRAPYPIDNCTHLVFSSNEDWVVPVGADDRRFVIPDVSSKYKGDTDYFNRLTAEIEEGGREAFVYDMLNHDLKDFNPREIPDYESKTKELQKLLGAESVAQWLHELLDDGDVYTANPAMESPDWDADSVFFIGTDLYRSYESFRKGARGGITVSRR